MKDSLTLVGMLALWRERRLLEVDEATGLRLLYDHNYYRISAYSRHFQVDPTGGSNDFRDGTRLADIKVTYEFDRVLGKILFDGLSDVEVTFRSRLAYHLAQIAPMAYLDEATYIPFVTPRGTDKRAEALDDARRDVTRSREPFVLHHLARDGEVPIWAAVETFTFGTSSRLFELLADTSAVDAIAKSFGLVRATAAGTFQSLATLRNICAHHGRLWNRIPARAVPVKQALRPQLDGAGNRTPWAWVVVTRDLVDAVRRDSTFSTEITEYLGDFDDMLEGLKHPVLR